jgi:four helix bundle protein
MFGFQRLDAYQNAILFLAVISKLTPDLPRGHAELADQLRRAALSVPLNIAEGSGKFNRDAIRFYGIARGSALECAAILDVIEALGLMDSAVLIAPRRHLESAVRLLTGLMRPAQA